MESTVEIVNSLNEILLEQEPVRIELIKSFQNKVWNDEIAKDEACNEILSELAYDLDFYEPNEEWRKEDSSYYGDDKLEEMVKSTIQKLQAIAKKA